MEIARWIGRRLEAGEPVLPLAGPLGRVWDALAARAIARPLDLSAVAQPVVAVGGATLGGSGRTPVALACARELARAGARVAIVGHAYRARPGHARVVAPDDAIGAVGDEALALAREAAGEAICVVVGPTRGAALALAARGADAIVLDGVLQTTPRRAHLSVLAVDGVAPWGSDRPPPWGDRRAPRDALLAACDAVVAVVDDGDADGNGNAIERRLSLPAGAPPLVRVPVSVPVQVAAVESRGARLSSRLLTWSELRAARVGLFTALARPDRVLSMLARRGVVPRVHLAAADHRGGSAAALARARGARGGRGGGGGGGGAAERSGDVDVWLAPTKCAAHLGGDLGGAPVAVLDYALRLGVGVGVGGSLACALRALVAQAERFPRLDPRYAGA